jgi:hypothetical protein
MRIINSTGQRIEVTSYLNRFRDAPWKPVGAIPNNGSKEINMSSDGIELVVKYCRTGDIEDSRYGWNPSGFIFAGQHDRVDYPNTTLVVITSHPGHRIIDYKHAVAPYKKGIEQLTGANQQVTDDVQSGVDAGFAIISALATGVAALGPVGAVPSGALLGFGSLLLMTIAGNGSTPPPPNAAEIEAIVAKVVKRELDQQDAEKAATAFTIASDELLRLAQRVKDHFPENEGGQLTPLNPHIEEDVERFIHRSIELHGEGTLLFSLKHMIRHPEMAMWILPQLVPGIATYLAALRSHILVSCMASDGSNEIHVQMSDVEYYLSEVDDLFNGLKEVYQTKNKYVQGKTAAVGLQGTLVESEFKATVIKSMYGVDYLDDPVTETLYALERISNLLKSDIEKGIPEHFWKVEELA